MKKSDIFWQTYLNLEKEVIEVSRYIFITDEITVRKDGAETTQAYDAQLNTFGSVRKLGCKRQTYAHSFVNLKRKKGISATPLNWLLNAFTLALNDSAPALVCLFTK